MSIHSYAQQGDLDHLEHIFQNSTSTSNDSPSVNTRDADQNTALHFASAGGYLSCAQLLIKHHADVDAKNKFGVTALHEACRNDKPNLAKLLCEKGSKIHAADTEGWTALHYAAYAKSVAVCEILLDLGSKVHATTIAGHTPLHIAASNGAADVVLLLVKRGASLDARDNNKVTPLSYLQKDKDAPKTAPTQESASKDILTNYKQLINNKQFSDLTLECNDNTSVSTHKCIISVQCPAIIKSAGQSSKLKMDASHKVVQLFLEYLYCGHIPEKLPLGSAFQVYAIACRFDCDGMQKVAQNVIQSAAKPQLAELKSQDIDYVMNSLKEPPGNSFSQFCCNWILSNYSGFEASVQKHITPEDLSRVVKNLLPKHSRESNNNNHSSSKGISPKSFLEFKQPEEGVKTLEGKNLRICTNITKALLKEPGAADWFGAPVDPIALGIPDYPTIIKHPMDLGTIMKNLETGQYHNIAEWMADIRLVFANALLYNPSGTEVNALARALQESFERRLSSASSGFEKANKKKKPTTPKEQQDENATPKSPKSAKKRKPEAKSNGSAKKVQKSSKADSPSSSPLHPSTTIPSAPKTATPPPASAPQKNTPPPASVPQKNTPPPQTTQKTTPPPQKNQKPEVKTETPRSHPQANNNTAEHPVASQPSPMSFEEKKQLGESMNKLTSEQLLEAIEIISASKNISGEDDSDTIDIDMNDMDEVTLRKLEKFIKECFRNNIKGTAA